jgi:hypothetical protein
MFGWRKRVGYIGPTVMEVVPYEFYKFAPDGVGLVGVTCNIDDWSADYFDQALAQVTTGRGLSRLARGRFHHSRRRALDRGAWQGV